MQSDGNEAISSPIFISGSSNQPPSVSIISPVNNATYSVGDQIVISANASDADGSIQKVDFYQGTTIVGSDNTSPYSYIWAANQAGTYSLTAVATDNLGATATSPVVSVIVNAVPVSLVFTGQIASGNDDVEETAKGSVSLSSDDIELVYETKTAGSQVVVLRVNTITIPKGAIITKAYIHFTVDEATSASCNLNYKR